MTTYQIDAEKARDIARAHDPSLAVDVILKGIEACAREGKYEDITREFGFGNSACYAAESDYPEPCKAILRELRALGFKAHLVEHENQFGDSWLSVRWED